MNKILIKPSMFVSKPFVECPKCHKNKYGVLMINARSYVRRCNDCMYSENYKLPNIKKKIIYLDQMAISNMMNSIRPTTDKRRKSKIKTEWKTMFEKLDRLVKLQLIICPHSPVHEDESIVSTVFQDLKKMYEHLSYGTSFYAIETITRFQLYVAFMKWLGKDVDDIQTHDIIRGDIDEWQDRIRISVNWDKNTVDYVKELEKIRSTSSANLVKIFSRWRTERDKNFMDWFNEERKAYGPAYWGVYIQSVLMSDPTKRFESMLSEKSALIVQLKNILTQNGIHDEKEKLLKLDEFFKSEQVEEIPFLTIYAMLCAVIGEQSAHQGRIQHPNRGASNDLSFISAFTPYCDAMFIDNAFKEYAKQGDRILKIGIANKFYSSNNFSAFFEYLDVIEKSASKEHINKVKEVYGEDWGEPYVAMYQ